MDRGRTTAFTLIELMVVIVIVVILALALTPMFRELITKAKFAEATPVLSMINAKLKMCLMAESNGVRNALIAVSPSLPTRSGESPDKTICSRGDGYDVLDNQTGEILASSTNTAFFDILGLSVSGFAGKYFACDDYQIRIDHWLPTEEAFTVAVAAVGSGKQRGGSVGTGYACLTVSLPGERGVTRLFATWERYSRSAKDRGGKKLFLRGNVDYPLRDESSIPMPSYKALKDATDPKQVLEKLGWTCN